MMILGDTIAAVSTPRGKGGVALLRISGPDAIGVAERVFLPRNGIPLSQSPSRHAVYGSILSVETDGTGNVIDDGIATVFRAPSSFTGEDTVEITCHGGILLTETVLTSILAAGARGAEAGEFTRRAFVNGKIGLSSAEALGNLLEAQTREQMTLAHTGMSGKVEERCRQIYDDLKHAIASIYVRIDYPDEDLADMGREEIDEILDRAIADLEALADTYRTGHAVQEGIATVICGKPNVGKSSLYNCILGRDAAIVTDIEGTTRDVLHEGASLGKITVHLYDTAGLRKTEDTVERIGIERTQAAMKEAELILAVFDASMPPDEEDNALLRQLKDASDATVIAVLNKVDVGDRWVDFYRSALANTVTFSAKEESGLAELGSMAERLLISGDLDLKKDAILTNARQSGAVLAALGSLRRAKQAVGDGLPYDLCCTDIEAAMEAISQLDGRSISEDIVGEIFSHFCVGK